MSKRNVSSAFTHYQIGNGSHLLMQAQTHQVTRSHPMSLTRSLIPIGNFSPLLLRRKTDENDKMMNAKPLFLFAVSLIFTFQITAQDTLFADSDIFFAENSTIIFKQEGLEKLLQNLPTPKVVNTDGTIRILEYKIDTKDLPQDYQDLAKRTFYSPQEDGTYREGKILEFIYRKELPDREYHNRVEASEKAIIQLVNNDAGTIEELIARLDYCNEYVALTPSLVKFVEVKEMPLDVKNRFIASENYHALQKRFVAYQEKTHYSLEHEELEKYIYYRGKLSPTGTIVHIVSVNIGSPCGDDFYENYQMFLTENHGIQSFVLRERTVPWEEDEAIYNFFQNTKTGTIYYRSESNTELKINSLTPNGEAKVEATRRLHFYTCGC